MIRMLSEGLRMFGRSIHVKLHGLRKYSGSDEQICKKIIEECYDDGKKYFRTSTQNYPVFYARDFGWCTQSLIKFGYRAKVLSTLSYALQHYKKHNGITVLINRQGRALNFPDVYSPDSVAYFFRSLRITDATDLIMQHAAFLNKELRLFADTVIDPMTHCVRLHHFSGMRDYSIVKGSCYDMIMACMLDDEIGRINKMMKKKVLVNPLKEHHLKKSLIKHFWNGKHFVDSVADPYCSGHCNVYSYWLDVITDKKMMESSLRALQRSSLDKPLPLQYGASKHARFLWYEFVVSGWEKDTIWTMLGMAYMDVLSRFDQKTFRKHMSHYKEIIEENGFVELYDKKLRPYQSLFFASDNSMLWASMYLEMKKRVIGN